MCKCSGAVRMRSKSQEIREALIVGNQIGALRIAARFFDRSVDTMIFKRGDLTEFTVELGIVVWVGLRPIR